MISLNTYVAVRVALAEKIKRDPSDMDLRRAYAEVKREMLNDHIFTIEMTMPMRRSA